MHSITEHAIPRVSAVNNQGITLARSAILDPISAYDLFAPYYRSYCTKRARYLEKIEQVVISEAQGAPSLLDIGAGDGRRALRIAAEINAKRVVLVEPSAAMRAQCSAARADFLSCRALEIPLPVHGFDVITCLWNVLGHMQDAAERVESLSRMKQLLRPGGKIFLDVSHRYNAATFGWTKTLLRIAHDMLFRSERHGDVVVSWNLGEQRILTQGHVFTTREMNRLLQQAGLRVKRRWVIGYENGEERKLSFLGNLLYEAG